jgi:double-stranded uracil-DNA glycosylase
VAEASGPADPPLDLSHLAADEVPLALADRHRSMAVGDRLHALLPDGGGPNWATDQVHGAGFDLVSAAHGPPGAPIGVVATRARTLPDYVGAAMVLLVCGLNPSLYAADAGVGFARPGNRFWPAMLAAGVATVDRDPRHLLVHHRVGMTDLVKRATPRADALSADEYRAGIARLGRRCAALRPAAVCVVGFDGWRRVVDRRAVAGWQPTGVGGSPVYLMPNPSGLNAHTTLAGFVDHLRAACRAASGGACS